MLLNNRYEVLKELSQGAFGKTYLAADLNSPSRRKCVVKQLNPDRKCDFQLARERFEREAAVLEHLAEESRQIPKLYAYVVEGGQFYLVQEFVDGPTLAQKVAEEGRLSEPVVREIVIKLLDVLEYVHSQSIIHRDIKPDNIILRTKDNLPVLLDFGIVKEVTRLDTVGNPTGSMIGGTSGFMPLEQAAGRPMFVSDIFAVGATAISLLTGKSPTTMTDPRTGNLNWESYAGNISRELIEILNRSTRQLPQDRYPDTKEMQAALTRPITQPKIVHSVGPNALPQTFAAPPSPPPLAPTIAAPQPPVLTPTVVAIPGLQRQKGEVPTSFTSSPPVKLTTDQNPNEETQLNSKSLWNSEIVSGKKLIFSKIKYIILLAVFVYFSRSICLIISNDFRTEFDIMFLGGIFDIFYLLFLPPGLNLILIENVPNSILFGISSFPFILLSFSVFRSFLKLKNKKLISYLFTLKLILDILLFLLFLIILLFKEKLESFPGISLLLYHILGAFSFFLMSYVYRAKTK